MKTCINCYEAEASINGEMCPECFRSLNGLPAFANLDGDGNYATPLEELNFEGTGAASMIDYEEQGEEQEEYVNSDDLAREELADLFGVTWEQLAEDLE